MSTAMHGRELWWRRLLKPVSAHSETISLESLKMVTTKGGGCEGIPDAPNLV
ncbi:hypothetical protein PtA15_18A33 [Puccinia triticina]|uniref:Uncharacterized protein n=1 Tax=Puccinia triticina TaxID=208348 RepID=A0ABY7D5P9_9BASI|nr:uncharacterized protein PtA15_18A33 [Puccinia triticina]WAQ92978.1 hypothetical protein PtA15_18A33 [Puccinia triticina]